MDKVVKVEITSQYGRERIFPANPNAFHFAAIANQRTLGRDVLALIEKLGFTVEIVPQVL